MTARPTRSQMARLEQIADGHIIAAPDAAAYRLAGTGRAIPAPVLPRLVKAGWVNPPQPGQPLTLTEEARYIVAWERRWAPLTPEQQKAFLACWRPHHGRELRLDGYQRHYEGPGWHNWAAEVAELTAAGLIRPGPEHYELTAAGRALVAPVTPEELP